MNGIRHFGLGVSILTVIAWPAAQADTLFGLYSGAGTWLQEAGGDIASGISTVEVESDLALEDQNGTVFYLALEHGVPVLPNIRAQHFAIDLSGENTLSRDIEFNGEHYQLADTVATEFYFRQTDLVMYYELLDNIVSLDLGLAVSHLDGYIELVSDNAGDTRASFDEFLPMLYASTRLDLPFTGLWVGAEAQGLGYSDSSLVELAAKVGYESSLGLGFEAGWRALQMEVDGFEEVDGADIDISGPYVTLNFHF